MCANTDLPNFNTNFGSLEVVNPEIKQGGIMHSNAWHAIDQHIVQEGA